MAMQQPAAPGRETIDALTHSLDQALGLLRRGRYGELGEHLRGFEQQADGLEALKRALQGGSPPPAGVRESCQQLGRRLMVFSEVARHVAALEFGVLELLAGPRDSSYGPDGQCAGSRAIHHFQQEA
jgi:hypothetical protein